jgi:hypothetical protein
MFFTPMIALFHAVEITCGNPPNVYPPFLLRLFARFLNLPPPPDPKAPMGSLGTRVFVLCIPGPYISGTAG